MSIFEKWLGKIEIVGSYSKTNINFYMNLCEDYLVIIIIIIIIIIIWIGK